MIQPYTVALVLDPEFGEAMRPLAKTMHVWAVGSATNRAVAEDLWKNGPQPFEYNNELGVTPFDYDPHTSRQAWCEHVLGTIDQHHDQWSHDPPYSVLEVHGLAFRPALRPAFAELGFLEFEEAPYGFRAIKPEP